LRTCVSRRYASWMTLAIASLRERFKVFQVPCPPAGQLPSVSLDKEPQARSVIGLGLTAQRSVTSWSVRSCSVAWQMAARSSAPQAQFADGRLPDGQPAEAELPEGHVPHAQWSHSSPAIPQSHGLASRSFRFVCWSNWRLVVCLGRGAAVSFRWCPGPIPLIS
jgi:hypothetical protein